MLNETIAALQENKPQDVSAMVERINSALFDRATFERLKTPKGSHVLLRKVAAKFADSRKVAAFFVALNANPETVFNKVRKEGTRTNLYSLLKLRQMIDYVTGRKSYLDRVSYSLFACSIIAANKGVEWLSSQEQELILSPERVESLPSDIRKAIASYQHRHMTLEGDSRNEASRFRTIYDTLGCFIYSREEFANNEYSLGLFVDLSNPLVAYLAKRWNLERNDNA